MRWGYGLFLSTKICKTITKMAVIDRMKFKIILTVEQLDSLDDLLDLYLEGENNERGINYKALGEVRDNISKVMEVVNQRLGFSSTREDDEPKYLI